MNPIHSSLHPTGDLAPAVVPPLALLSGLGMIVVALGFAAYAVRRQLGWDTLTLGALAWSVTVFLKFA